MLYAYISGAGNNGSAFAGLNANTPWWNVTLGRRHARRALPHDRPRPGHRRLDGRQEDGAARARAPSPPTARSSPALLVGVIVIVGALTFFPALSLGPVVEHFVAHAGQVY